MKYNCSLHNFTSGLLSNTGHKNSFHRTKGTTSHYIVNNAEAQTTSCSICFYHTQSKGQPNTSACCTATVQTENTCLALSNTTGTKLQY